MMNTKVGKLKLLMEQKKRMTGEHVIAACQFCGKESPTYKMIKGEKDGKWYCDKKHADKAAEGESELERFGELAGIKK